MRSDLHLQRSIFPCGNSIFPSLAQHRAKGTLPPHVKWVTPWKCRRWCICLREARSLWDRHHGCRSDRLHIPFYFPDYTRGISPGFTYKGLNPRPALTTPNAVERQVLPLRTDHTTHFEALRFRRHALARAEMVRSAVVASFLRHDLDSLKSRLGRGIRAAAALIAALFLFEKPLFRCRPERDLAQP